MNFFFSAYLTGAEKGPVFSADFIGPYEVLSCKRAHF